MNDLISRQEAIRLYCREHCGWEPKKCPLTFERDGTEECSFVRLLKGLPSVQPEQKRGKWEEFAYATTYDICGLNKAIGLKCSLCKEKKYDRVKTQYCPNCGAKMEE